MVPRWVLVMVTLSAMNARAVQPPSNDSKALGLITGLPYTAQQLTTTTVVHPDGSKTITIQQAELARNSAGSTCYVVHAAVSSKGSVAPASSPVVSTLIRDAKVQQAIHIDPASKTALITALPSITGIPKTSQVTLFRSGFAKPTPPQSLGSNTLVGLVVNGTRVVRTSLSGASPNNVTTDTWFSPGLSVVVESDTQDSSGGSRKVALSSLIPGEPDPSLFVIPSGYIVTK